jgi:hypothetical protein
LQPWLLHGMARSYGQKRTLVWEETWCFDLPTGGDVNWGCSLYIVWRHMSGHGFRRIYWGSSTPAKFVNPLINYFSKFKKYYEILYCIIKLDPITHHQYK